MTPPCRACLPIDCTGFGEERDIYSVYSLQQPPFIFTTNCPPGYSCSDAPFLLLECCGERILVDLIGVTEPQRTEKINEAFSRCAQLWTFCGTGGGDDGNGTFKFFFNNLATCTGTCPDGNVFRYQVAPGWVAALSQSAADALAGLFSCELVQERKICIGSLSPLNICMDSAYIAVVVGTSRYPLTWSISGGALPTGLGLVPYTDYKVRIAGTPTAAGSYTFTLKATNRFGNYMEKSFTIYVLGVTNAGTLPNGSITLPYSYAFTASGGVPPYIFSWGGGTQVLPPGLAMNDAGVVSGTPESQGVFNNFRVAVRDSLGVSCGFACSLTVGIGNDPQSYTAFCPGDPTKWTHIDIPGATFLAGSADLANELATQSLNDQLRAGQIANGCVCPGVQIDIVNRLFMADCDTTVAFSRDSAGAHPTTPPTNNGFAPAGVWVDFGSSYQAAIGQVYHGTLYVTPNNFSFAQFLLNFP